MLKRVQHDEAIKKVEIAASLALLAMTPSKDTGFRVKPPINGIGTGRRDDPSPTPNLKVRREK
jgi:hypothetical protein